MRVITDNDGGRCSIHGGPSRRAAALVLMTPLFARSEPVDAYPAPLRIGVEDRWPPFAYEQGGKARGTCVDLVRAALTAAGIPHQFEPMPYRRCLHLTRLGQLDACMTVPNSAGMQADFALSCVPLFSAVGLVLALKGGPHDHLLGSLQELRQTRLAVTKGFDYGPAFDAIGAIETVPTPHPEQVFDLLKLNRADYTVYEAFRVQELFARRPELRSQFSIVGSLPAQGAYLAFSRQLRSVQTVRLAFDRALQSIQARADLRAGPQAPHR